MQTSIRSLGPREDKAARSAVSARRTERPSGRIGFLDAAIVRLRSTAVLQVPRYVGGSEIAACRAVGLSR
jgi:hypothetical protein